MVRFLGAVLAGCLLFEEIGFGAAPSRWILENSELTYHVSHPLHAVMGTSREAKGKGECLQRGCHFLLGAEVKTFTSGDSNRDLHMQEATRGAEFPMAGVEVRFPSLPRKGWVKANLTVEFAGEKHDYKAVPFRIVRLSKRRFRAEGKIPLTLENFKIKPPSLMGMKIENEIPVTVKAVWKKAKTKKK